MLHHDALTGEDLVLRFLHKREFLLARFLVRDQELFAYVIGRGCLKIPGLPETKALEPRLGWRKFALEHAVVVGLAHPTRTDVEQFARRVTQRHGFEGVALFFPE